MAFIVTRRKDIKKEAKKIRFGCRINCMRTPQCGTKILNLLLIQCDILTYRFCKSILFQTEEVVSMK